MTTLILLSAPTLAAVGIVVIAYALGLATGKSKNL